MKIKKKEEEEENLGKKGCRVVREVTQTLRWREENVEKWNCQPTHTHTSSHTCTHLWNSTSWPVNAMLGGTEILGTSDGRKRGWLEAW